MLGGVVRLLPTPTAVDARGSRNNTAGREPDSTAHAGDTLTDAMWKLLPTPRNRDYKGATASRCGDNKHDLPSALLPTPAAADGARGQDFAREGRSGSGGDDLVTLTVKADRDRSWGKYEAAVRQWEELTRLAPSPSEPNRNGKPRLAAPFSEWMLGWPAGWVTAIEGLTRPDMLRIIGNGVVPQQALAALRILLDRIAA